MPKADFINAEWQRVLERASRAADVVPLFDERLVAIERYVMATYEDLKREVGEIRDGVKVIVSKYQETSALLKDAQAKLEAGQVIDYSELAASLDEAQKEIADAIVPTPVIEEVAEEKPQEEVAPPAETPPAEPTP
jgi:uncharacterized membrane protein